jgi:hypothetical protein
MEDLLENFIQHLEKNVSIKLGEDLKRYINDVMNNSPNAFEENYEEIEHGIKQIIGNFFKNCEHKIFLEISKNLYNGYIDYDDNNIISAVKYFVRVYSKFEEIKVKKMFYRWRINILYPDNKKDNLGNYNKNISSSINNENFDSPISIETFNKLQQTKNKKKNFKNNNDKNTNDIFNKLYMDSFKKQDERLLKDEFKKISELEECTFRPKISKII